MLPSILVLGLAAVAALLLTLNRRSPPELAAERSSAARMLLLALVIQSIHFAEETVTGFHERFPGLFGLPEIPFYGFVAFNLAWIGIWLVSVPGLRSAHSAAFFASWFLAIAGMVNGIAHPVLALADGSYFPGLVTSPFIALACVFLWQRLRQATIYTAHTA